jgi:hypothetical protein
LSGTEELGGKISTKGNLNKVKHKTYKHLSSSVQIIHEEHSSSGMSRRVPLVRTDVSEERIAIVVPSSRILVTLMMGGDTFLRKVYSLKSHTM